MPSKNDNRHKIIGGRHRALARYYMMCHRVKNTRTSKNASYKGVQVLVSKEDFVKWFMARDFERCSIDRIDNNGHYDLLNMQVIPLTENIAKDKRLANNGVCRCYVCKQQKTLNDFVSDNRRTTGKSTICKACDSKRVKNESREAREQRRKREAVSYQKRKASKGLLK
jgi:hypothetical protein